jgi:alpha-amylase
MGLLSSATPPDGDYYLVSQVGSGQFAADAMGDVINPQTSRNVHLWTWGSSASAFINQLFRITRNASTGFYTLINPNQNRSLDLADSNTAPGTNIRILNNNNSCAQRWQLRWVLQDIYEIRSSCDTEMAMDVANGVAANSTNIWLVRTNNTAAQRWRIVPAN